MTAQTYARPDGYSNAQPDRFFGTFPITYRTEGRAAVVPRPEPGEAHFQAALQAVERAVGDAALAARLQSADYKFRATLAAFNSSWPEVIQAAEQLAMIAPAVAWSRGPRGAAMPGPPSAAEVRKARDAAIETAWKSRHPGQVASAASALIEQAKERCVRRIVDLASEVANRVDVLDTLAEDLAGLAGAIAERDHLIALHGRLAAASEAMTAGRSSRVAAAVKSLGKPEDVAKAVVDLRALAAVTPAAVEPVGVAEIDEQIAKLGPNPSGWVYDDLAARRSTIVADAASSAKAEAEASAARSRQAATTLVGRATAGDADAASELAAALPPGVKADTFRSVLAAIPDAVLAEVLAVVIEAIQI